MRAAPAGLAPRLRAGVAIAREVHDRGRQRAVDQLAAGSAYFAFLALVPLLLLVAAVAGFLLQDPSAQDAVTAAVAGAVPGLEASLVPGGPLDQLLSTAVRRRAPVGAFGLVGLLWVGVRLAGSLMAGVEQAFGARRQTGPRARLRQAGSLVLLGLVLLVGVAASGLASGLAAGLVPWLPGPAGRLLALAAGIIVGAGFDLLLFTTAYRMLLSDRTLRTHLPGALLGMFGWAGLKVFGATFLGIRVASAGAVYGTLAGVVTLLLLLYVMARLFLTGAVLSAVVDERRAGAIG